MNWTFEKAFEGRKNRHFSKNKSFYEPTIDLQKNLQKPTKTYKNLQRFSGAMSDLQEPTVKKVCRFTSQLQGLLPFFLHM